MFPMCAYIKFYLGKFMKTQTRVELCCISSYFYLGFEHSELHKCKMCPNMNTKHDPVSKFLEVLENWDTLPEK